MIILLAGPCNYQSTRKKKKKNIKVATEVVTKTEYSATTSAATRKLDLLLVSGCETQKIFAWS